MFTPEIMYFFVDEMEKDSSMAVALRPGAKAFEAGSPAAMYASGKNILSEAGKSLGTAGRHGGSFGNADVQKGKSRMAGALAAAKQEADRPATKLPSEALKGLRRKANLSSYTSPTETHLYDGKSTKLRDTLQHSAQDKFTRDETNLALRRKQLGR